MSSLKQCLSVWLHCKEKEGKNKDRHSYSKFNFRETVWVATQDVKMSEKHHDI